MAYGGMRKVHITMLILFIKPDHAHSSKRLGEGNEWLTKRCEENCLKGYLLHAYGYILYRHKGIGKVGRKVCSTMSIFFHQFYSSSLCSWSGSVRDMNYSQRSVMGIVFKGTFSMP